MPVVDDNMPTESEMRSRRDSWPPTQVRLEQPDPKQDTEPRPLLDRIEDDPLTYFLTPASPQEFEEDDYCPMDLDAGIEDPNHPQEMVRSVSPSSLEGLRKPDHDRPSSPECDSDMTSPDEDDDEEYIRFSTNNSRLTSSRDLDVDNRARSPLFGRSTNALLSPASFPAPSRSSYAAAAGRRGRPRSLSVRRRPSHLWREPSPDVWSIEEETEEELSEMGNSMDVTTSDREDGAVERRKKAAKPRKRVRFVLPVKE